MVGRAPHTRFEVVIDGKKHIAESVTMTTAQRLGKWLASNLLSGAVVGVALLGLAAPYFREVVQTYGAPHMKAAEAEHTEIRDEIKVTNSRIDADEKNITINNGRIDRLEGEHNEKMVYLREIAREVQKVLDGQATAVVQNDEQNKRLDAIERKIGVRSSYVQPWPWKPPLSQVAGWLLRDRGRPENR